MSGLGAARTIREMCFAAGLVPCPRCGVRALAERSLDLARDGDTWKSRTGCSECGNVWELEFTADGDPTIARRGRYDLGAGRSSLISAAQFLDVLDASLARLAVDQQDAITHAVTSITELFKLLPPDRDAIPDATDSRLTRAWIRTEFGRLRGLAMENAPPPGITPHANAHIEDRDLSRTELDRATFEKAVLRRVVLTEANLYGTSLREATIESCVLTHADLSTAKFEGAVVRGSDFTGSDLDSANFINAKVEDAKFDGARFGSAVFDRAVFERCSFREASFARFRSEPVPSSEGTKFVDCDLTGTDWTDRDLSRTRFVRCKVRGARGKPKAYDGIVLQDCDLDTRAFVDRISNIEDKQPRAANSAIVTKLIEPPEPPRTVGALFDALLVSLDKAGVEDDTLVAPPGGLERISGPATRLTARFEPTDAALRDRKVMEFSLVTTGRNEILTALRARHGKERIVPGTRGDDYWVFGPWVYTERSCCLAWYAELPTWLATPADWRAQRGALRELYDGARDATSVDELVSAAEGFLLSAREDLAIEIAFSPPIPAKELIDAFVWKSTVAVDAREGWTLRTIGGHGEPLTKPLSVGPWPFYPHLEHAPTGGATSDALHSCQSIDVVASMRIGLRASPTRTAAEYDRRILERLALWEVAPEPQPSPKADEKVITLKDFTTGARQVIAAAQTLADERKHKMMTPVHVLAKLLAIAAVQEELRAATANPERALVTAEVELSAMPTSTEPSYLSDETIALLDRARAEAKGAAVSLSHLLAATLKPTARSTLADIDKHGIAHKGEERSIERVIRAGELDRWRAS